MSKLKRIADEMMLAAIAKSKGFEVEGGSASVWPVVESRLGGGVVLRMYATPLEFRLLVIRPTILPSDAEMKVFRNVFECPSDIEQEPGGGLHAGFYYLLVWSIPEKLKRQQAPLDLNKEPAQI